MQVQGKGGLQACRCKAKAGSVVTWLRPGAGESAAVVYRRPWQIGHTARAGLGDLPACHHTHSHSLTKTYTHIHIHKDPGARAHR